MDKQEFLNRIKSKNIPTDRQYKDIEYVYTWHPSIDEVNGKDQIAKLWDIGGIRIIMDMKPTAEKEQLLEHQIALAEAQVQKLRRASFDLMLGGNGNIEEQLEEINMKYKINLNDLSKVKEFVAVTQNLVEPVILRSGEYVVDAKSILGILSLDLSKSVELEIKFSENDSVSHIQSVYSLIKKFEG